MNETKTKTLPMLALRGLVVFPGMQLHFDVGRRKSVNAVQSAMANDRIVFLSAQKDTREDDPDADSIYKIGCVARINQVIKLSNDAVRVVVEGIYRGITRNLYDRDDCFFADVEEAPVHLTKISAAKKAALINSVREAFGEYAEVSPKLPPDVIIGVMAAEDVEALSDFVASNVPFELDDKQYLLELFNPFTRLEKLVGMLAFQKRVMVLEKEIGDKVHARLDDNQRDYYLREQMRVISEELGDDDDPIEEAEEYRNRIKKLHLEGEVEEKLLKEAGRLGKMPPGSHEGAVIRGYLDICLELPWNIKTQDKNDVKKAKKVLDNDHYGLDKVKERILELLAVRKLSPDIKGQIICLIGPPGVGKTSIARSIAKCMGRKFARISLGGVRDEADIRGHRKTYVGAMPGRIINAVISSKSSNPLILMDEIDKMASDFRGDPAAALLEALDPEQNSTFTDHFLEIPFDLSNVLFVLTANSDDTIPAALYDRMEIIRLSSYTRQEKLMIAKRHLLKKQLRRHGLDSSVCKINDGALYSVIDGYTREAGVRNLERNIAKLCRKSAMEIVEGAERVKITPKNIENYLGVRKFRDESAGEGMTGLINGLAWTSVGGEVMPIEAAVMPGSGKLILTGSLGDIMKESAQEALGYIRSRSKILNVNEDFYKNLDIHINATEGAVPKDGPSAGVAMTAAMISALTGAKLRGDVAVTGEITLLGRVLAIGGLREKAMAAYKYGVKTVVIPNDNVPTLSELDKVLTDNLKFVPVRNISEALPVLFEDNTYLKPSDINSHEKTGSEDTGVLIKASESPEKDENILPEPSKGRKIPPRTPAN